MNSQKSIKVGLLRQKHEQGRKVIEVMEVCGRKKVGLS